MAFYLEIWQEREKVCFESGEKLGSKPLLYMFHHVLPKRESGGFPQYRHCKWNIVILSWNAHTTAERNIDLTPKVKAYTEKLMQLHKSGKLDRIDPNRHFIT